jgi:hypothetical protein
MSAECIHGPLDGDTHDLTKRLLVVGIVEGFPAILYEQVDDEDQLLKIPRQARLLGRYHKYTKETRGLRWLPY